MRSQAPVQVISAGRVDSRRALAFGWERTKADLGFWLFATALFRGGSSVLSWIAHAAGPFGLPLLFVDLFVPIVLAIGYTQVGIDAADGKEPRVAVMWAGWRQTISFFVTGCLIGLVVLCGTLLFVVPGIIWSAQFMMAPHFVVDRKMGPLAAMRASSIVTKGIKTPLLAFTFWLTMLNLAGFLCLGVGVLVSAPVTTIAMGLVFREIVSARERELAQPGS